MEGMQEQLDLESTTVTPEDWINSNADVEPSAAITDEDIIQEYLMLLMSIVMRTVMKLLKCMMKGHLHHLEVQDAIDVLQQYSLYLESTIQPYK